MPIAQAVAPAVKTPGLYLTVNLLAGASRPGTAALRALIVAPKSSAGTLTEDTEVRQVFGPDDAAAALGPGTPGHLAAKRYFERNGSGPVDVIAPAASAGGVAATTQSFTGTATESSTIRLRVHGRAIDVPWLSGEDGAAFAARAVVYLSAHASDLFVTASDGGSGDLDYTAKVAGPWGNDVRLHASVLEGGGGITIAANPAALAGGTTEPDFSTALETVAVREYAAIIGCCSNADAAAAGSGNAKRLADHIDGHESGNAALLQVGFIGHTGAIADVKAGAASRNNEALSYPYGQDFDDLPCELAAAEAGDAMRFAALRPNYNRIGNAHNLFGPRDRIASKLTPGEMEDLLNSGVTPLDVARVDGAVTVVRPITTHSLDGSSPDFRAFDLSDTLGLYAVARDLRAALPQQFPNASISEDLEQPADPLPPGVVERRDVELFAVSRLAFWVRQGVVQGARLAAALAAGALVVEIDEADGSQVNLFLPLAIVKPLAKVGVVFKRAPSRGPRPFSPDQISGLVGWLRVAEATGIGTAGFQIPNLINPAAPGTQPTVSSQPTISTANAFPTMVFDGVADFLLWAVDAAIGDPRRRGIAAWLRFLSPIAGSAFVLGSSSGNLFVSALATGFNARLSGTVGGLPTIQSASATLPTDLGFHFLTWSFDGFLEASERVKGSIDGFDIPITSQQFTGEDEYPDTLDAITHLVLAARNTAGTSPAHLEVADVYATLGHLPSEDRANLRAFEPLV